MAAGMNEHNQTLHLARVPQGDAGPDDFEVLARAVLQPRVGDVAALPRAFPGAFPNAMQAMHRGENRRKLVLRMPVGG